MKTAAASTSSILLKTNCCGLKVAFPNSPCYIDQETTTMGSSFAHWSVAVSQDVLEKRGEFPFPEYTVNRNIKRMAFYQQFSYDVSSTIAIIVLQEKLILFSVVKSVANHK